MGILRYIKIYILFGVFWWRFGKGKNFEISWYYSFLDLVFSNSILVESIKVVWIIIEKIGRMGYFRGINVEFCYWFCSVKIFSW